MCNTMIFFWGLFIVNNGNILIDGHRYRKRTRIEM